MRCTVKSAAVLFIFAALLACTTTSWAIQWVGATGPWIDGSNWAGGSQPGVFDNAEIDNGGTAQLSGSDVGDADTLVLGSAAGMTGNLEMTGGQLFPNRIRIGEQGSGAAVISGGELLVGGGSLFVGGQDGTGSGELTINDPNSFVDSLDDFQLGRQGTGTLNLESGRAQGFFTVVGKFGTGIWNQSGGLFVAQNTMEIGDGGRPDQAGTAGPRTGTINLSGGVMQADEFAIGNRVGAGTVNVSGSGYLAVTEASGGSLWVGRGMNWEGMTGAGGATELRVTGGDAIVVANQDFLMNVPDVAISSTLVAEITGTDHTAIKVGGDADLTNGTFRVELTGFTPSSGDSWTILETGANFTSELGTIDAEVAAAGYPALNHNTAATGGTLMGTTFAVEDLSAPLPSGLSWQLAYGADNVVLSVVGAPTVTGDFNNDGSWNCLDIDPLTAEIVAGTNNPAFDMNGDGVVNLSDITDANDGWLTVGGANNPAQTSGNPFLVGDATLDGTVDVSDFNTWNGNKFTSVAAWCSGDFNADGSIDVPDFNLWNANKFTSSADTGSVVPEPGCAVLAFFAAVGILAARRRGGASLDRLTATQRRMPPENQP